MGREYVLLSGETDEQGAQAIEEHYLPRFSGDPVPETPEGAVVSMADKIDTITGCFSVGLIPSGSEDPYALRRQTLGVLSILTEKGYPVLLGEMVEESLTLLSGKIERDLEDVQKEILEYFKRRMSGLLISEGHRYDTVEAVLEAGFGDVIDTKKRVEALSTFRNNPHFEPFTVVCKRAMNIIKESKRHEVDENLFKHDSEKALYKAYLQSEKKVRGLIHEGMYEDALVEIASLRSDIDAFFDGVMVMDKDEEIRRNRLALLTCIAGLVSRIADFSRIVVD
jgi:glycyl-tRNA synthetase beta chain